MMDEKKRFFRPGLHAALIVFVVVIAAMLTVFAYAQYYLGMWGLLITELGVFLIALAGMWIFNVDFKVAVPVRRPGLRQITGTLLVWAGTYLVVLVLTLLMFCFFPDGISVSESLADFFDSWPVVPTILMTGVMPAICEEMLHRGFLMNCVWNTVRNRVGTCVIVGVLFGINHMDPYRFLPTAILGGVMAYVLIETNNFLYNMLFHFANNTIIEVLSLALGGSGPSDISADKMADIVPLGFAAYLIIGCAAPLLILGGVMLLQGLDRVKGWGKTKIIVSIVVAAGIGLAMLVIGMLIMIVYMLNGSFDNMQLQMGQSLLFMFG